MGPATPEHLLEIRITFSVFNVQIYVPSTSSSPLIGGLLIFMWLITSINLFIVIILLFTSLYPSIINMYIQMNVK